MSDITPMPAGGATSPFDSIRRVRDGGSEYWSARELQPLLGYVEWRKFSGCIDEAKRAAAITAGEGNLVDTDKVVERENRGSITVADVELTRYGAYMVAMSCDGRKPEVAAAKTYFAIRTREAETAQPAALPSTRQLAQMVIDAEDAREAAERQVQIERKGREAMESYAKGLEPRAEGYDRLLDGDGTYSVGVVAKMLGSSQNKLFGDLRSAGIFIAKGAMRNTPYQKYMHHFDVKAFEYTREDGTQGNSYKTRVRPSGIDFIARKLGRSVQSGLDEVAS